MFNLYAYGKVTASYEGTFWKRLSDASDVQHRPHEFLLIFDVVSYQCVCKAWHSHIRHRLRTVPCDVVHHKQCMYPFNVQFAMFSLHAYVQVTTRYDGAFWERLSDTGDFEHRTHGLLLTTEMSAFRCLKM